MNEAFISGEIISEIEYKFIINSKKNALAGFKLKLGNDSEIKCIAYDELADCCYRKLKTGKYVNMYGRLINNKDKNIMFLVKYFMR